MIIKQIIHQLIQWIPPKNFTKKSHHLCKKKINKKKIAKSNEHCGHCFRRIPHNNNNIIRASGTITHDDLRCPRQYEKGKKIITKKENVDKEYHIHISSKIASYRDKIYSVFLLALSYAFRMCCSVRASSYLICWTIRCAIDHHHWIITIVWWDSMNKFDFHLIESSSRKPFNLLS